MILRTTIFLIINFTALAFGGLFTSEGVPSEWYLSLLKAPWTPPGWVFGFAWSIIMICYAFKSLGNSHKNQKRCEANKE